MLASLAKCSRVVNTEDLSAPMTVVQREVECPGAVIAGLPELAGFGRPPVRMCVRRSNRRIARRGWLAAANRAQSIGALGCNSTASWRNPTTTAMTSGMSMA